MLLPGESISTATPTSSEIAVYGFLHAPPPPPPPMPPASAGRKTSAGATRSPGGPRAAVFSGKGGCRKQIKACGRTQGQEEAESCRVLPLVVRG